MSLAHLLRRISMVDSAAVEAQVLSEEWEATVSTVRAMIRAQLVPEQLALFESVNRWDAACAARQSGKTFVAARLLIDTALRVNDSISVYVSDTWDNAVKVMWVDQEDGLPAVLQALGLIDRDSRDPTTGLRPRPGSWHYHMNLSTRTVTFRNGSLVELAGADRGAWSKFRGRKLDLIVADEMQRQHQESLARALRSDLPDCFNVRRGRFVGIGTVGRALTGIWFEVNATVHGLCPPIPGWHSFHWTARELASLTDTWERQLEYARAMGIDITTDHEWMREKLGLWVRDELGLVHALDPLRSLWDGDLPRTVRTRCPEHGHLRGRCTCELPMVPRSSGPLGTPEVYAGLDLGFDDPNAVVIGTISREEGILRELHSEQRAGLDTSQLASWLRELMERHGIRRFYVDPAWKITVQDLRRLYNLPIEEAEKGDSGGTTEDLWHGERQAALRDGSMRVRRGSLLQTQLEAILRDPKALELGHVRAASGQDDHVYDAWRYLFRMVRTRHVIIPEPPVTAEDAALASVRELRAQALGPQAQSRDEGRPRDRLLRRH